jgi:hypothetical protein
VPVALIAGQETVTIRFPLELEALDGATGTSGTVVVVGATVVVTGGAVVVVGGVPSVTVVVAAAPGPVLFVAETDTVYVVLFASPVSVHVRFPFASAVSEDGEHVWPPLEVTV